MKLIFLKNIFLTDIQVSSLCKAFANNSVNLKLFKIQLSKKVQPGGFLGRLLRLLMKFGLPLMKDILKPLAKSVLIPLLLRATTSAVDAGIYKKVFGS